MLPHTHADTRIYRVVPIAKPSGDLHFTHETEVSEPEDSLSLSISRISFEVVEKSARHSIVSCMCVLVRTEPKGSFSLSLCNIVALVLRLLAPLSGVCRMACERSNGVIYSLIRHKQRVLPMLDLDTTTTVRHAAVVASTG